MKPIDKFIPSPKFIPSIDTEKYYYKMLFDKFYPNCSQILPYLWMPKYTDATDPSARTLDIYKTDNKNENDVI